MYAMTSARDKPRDLNRA